MEQKSGCDLGSFRTQGRQSALRLWWSGRPPSTAGPSAGCWVVWWGNCIKGGGGLGLLVCPAGFIILFIQVRKLRLQDEKLRSFLPSALPSLPPTPPRLLGCTPPPFAPHPTRDARLSISPLASPVSPSAVVTVSGRPESWVVESLLQMRLAELLFR